jgi:hypothetical protein
MATTKDSGEISTEELRAKAKELHIRFTKSTSDDVLLEKIEEAEKLLAPKIKKQFTNKNRMALVHVQVNSLDPYIQKQPHVFRQISNEVVSLKKAIALNKPIFLEQCMIDLLKSEKFMTLESNTQPADKIIREPKQIWTNRFNITYLDQPTEKDWKEDEKWKHMRKVKSLNDSANALVED